MRSKFSFFKAGQGSFYGGRIHSPESGKTFTVIYDCGTSRYVSGNTASLNREITLFKNDWYYHHSNDIDLLFISHLDYDHVSGIKRLLNEFNVKRIILPYIEKQFRQLFLISIFANDTPTDNDLSLTDYTTFLESPQRFIQEQSKNTTIYFVIDNNDHQIKYEGYQDEGESLEQDIYPMGTELNPSLLDELTGSSNTLLYDNNLQFFIQKKWEFTTYVKTVNVQAISSLNNCLKTLLGKSDQDELTLTDLALLITTNRTESRKCYMNRIGEINSHGLVLLHGPIRFRYLEGKIKSDCELNNQELRYFRFFDDGYHFRSNNRIMLGTLLLGDTSINPNNNPLNFSNQFKEKLENVHIVQVPHHGSSENWDSVEFDQLSIGSSIRWNNKIVSVCNFGYGNKYGHPSHEVLNDLSSSMYLNTQFSRLTIKYRIIDWRP